LSIRISIITISYNNEADIRATLESVINQTLSNYEYIVVDGASTDKTLEIIQEYNTKINKIISEPDKGLYDAINKGMKNSSGDIIGLIHAGDRLYNNQVLEKIALHFESNKIDAMYGHSVMVNKNDKPIRVNKSPKYNKSYIRRGWMPSHQSIYIRRKILDRYGYYNLNLHPSSDYEFFLRYFYFKSLKIKRLDSFIILFSLGGRSTRNYINNLKAQSQHKECWRVNGDDPPPLLVPFKLIRKIRQFYLGVYYRVYRNGY